MIQTRPKLIILCKSSEKIKQTARESPTQQVQAQAGLARLKVRFITPA